MNPSVGVAPLPLISVLVPAYNRASLIGRCLRSLVSQSLSHELFEVIVIDDGSTDETRLVASQFVSREGNTRVVHLRENRGLPSALNEGIAVARGEYLFRVDSDDFLNVNCLLILHTYVSLLPSVNAVAVDYIEVDDEEHWLSIHDCSKEPIACGVLFRTKCVIDVGLYDETFLCNEDLDFKFRFEKKFTIDRLPIPLYRYRKHDDNMTKDVEMMSAYKAILRDKHGTNF